MISTRDLKCTILICRSEPSAIRIMPHVFHICTRNDCEQIPCCGTELISNIDQILHKIHLKYVSLPFRLANIAEDPHPIF